MWKEESKVRSTRGMRHTPAPFPHSPQLQGHTGAPFSILPVASIKRFLVQRAGRMAADGSAAQMGQGFSEGPLPLKVALVQRGAALPTVQASEA